MPRRTTVVSVFLASPSDVFPERDSVTRSIQRWNAIRGKDRNLFFEIVKWETNTSSAIGLDAQDVISGQVDDDFDVMIALFWTRLGTETARAASGTVEEYERVLQRYKSGEPVQVSVYFKMSPPPLDGFSPKQYQGVLDLKERLKQDGVYYKEVQDDQSLDFEIDILLDRLARDYGSGGDATRSAGIPVKQPPNEEVGIPTDSEADDAGYLDILESMEEHSQAAVRFLDGNTGHLESIELVLQESTSKIEELKSLGPIQPADMRPIVSRITDALNEYSDFVEDGLEDYAVHSGGLAEKTRKLIDISEDFENSPEDVAAVRYALLQNIESMTGAIEGMHEFADSVRSLQRMTVKFNQARRRLVSNIEKLIELITYSKSVVTEAIKNLPE